MVMSLNSSVKGGVYGIFNSMATGCSFGDIAIALAVTANRLTQVNNAEYTKSKDPG